MSAEDAARYDRFWDEVKNGIDVDTRVKINNWDYTPSSELYLKYKDVYDNPKYFDQKTGYAIYPGMDGDINIDGFTNGVYKIETLTPGTTIDRYGSNGTGKYFSPEGTSYGDRALPPFMEKEPYAKYEVLTPFEVKSGEIVPWFDQPGHGTQYLSPYSVDELIRYGFIKELK